MQTSAGLRLAVVEYEANDPEKGDYLAITATVTNGAFAGQTLFWVALTDLTAFIGELDVLDDRLAGEARLRCGWGDEVLFDFRIAPEGRAGRLRASIAMTADSSSASRSNLATSFVLLPNELTSFRGSLRELVVAKAPGTAQLDMDLEAVV